MYMNNIVLFLIASLVMTAGCSTIKGVFGKSATQESKARTKVVVVEDYISKANLERLKQIGEFSYGISIVSNVPTPALTLNERITTLSEKPDLNAVKEMKLIVSQLETNNTKELQKKDAEISYLQNKQVELQADKEKVINQYMELAETTAMKSDTIQATLDKYQGWFGLKAIGMGLWQLIKSAFWGLTIFTVIFVVLRVLSMTNPIAASIFGIFNLVGSWFIHTIKALVPGAVNTAGLVAQSALEEYKTLTTKLVDSIQVIKQTYPDTNDTFKKTINLSPEESAKVTEIKTTLNYK